MQHPCVLLHTGDEMMCINNLNQLAASFKAGQGNDIIFNQIYNSLDPILRAVLHKNFCKEIDDILQITWMEIYDLLSKEKFIVSRGSFLSLTIAICLNNFRNSTRKWGRQNRLKEKLIVKMKRDAKQQTEAVVDAVLYKELWDMWTDLVPSLDGKLRSLVTTLGSPEVLSLQQAKKMLEITDLQYFHLKNRVVATLKKCFMDNYGGSKA